MSHQSVIASRLSGLRSQLEQIGAPVWELGEPKVLPKALLDLCREGTQLRQWVEEVAYIDLPTDTRLKVSFGWTLLNLDEIVEWRVGGVEYGAALVLDEVADAWMEDWVPILGHNDGVAVVDGSDQVHRLWWESGHRPFELDVAGIIDLLVSLLEDGTYVWDTEFGGFDFGKPEGHPILDYA